MNTAKQPSSSVVLAGRGRLMQHLKLRKVLVVIDDTDSEDQLRHLLPTCELNVDSMVIVTSRKRNVLSALGIHISEVQLLPEGLDGQLFKTWAFAAGPPDWDTAVLVPKVVACCGRLPLTLKVGTS